MGKAWRGTWNNSIETNVAASTAESFVILLVINCDSIVSWECDAA